MDGSVHRAAAAPAVASARDVRFLLAFTALAIAQFIIAIDITSLTVALPVIANRLGATSTQTFWASIGFLLVAVVTQPLLTSLSDILGRKTVLLVCAVTFAVGSVLMGSAQNMNMLIAGRLVQGLGGGGLDVLPEVILTDMVPLKDRSLWIGLQNLSVAIGTVSGPVLGGVLAEKATWRWLAWINLPLLGIILVCVPLFLTLKPLEGSLKQKLRQVDWGGVPLFLVGLCGVELPLTWGGVLFPWNSFQSLVPLVVGSLLLAGFIYYETTTSAPMIPPRFFTSRGGALPLIATFAHGLAIYTILYYLPIYFEATRGRTPLQAAVDVMPLSFTVIPVGVITALVIQTTKRYRLIIWISWAFAVAGTAMLSQLRTYSSKAAYTSFQVVAGVGYGGLFPALILPMQAAFPGDDAGLAMGTFVWFRLVGSVIGLALGSAIFNNVFNKQISAIDATLPPALEMIRNSRYAISFIPTLRTLTLPDALRTAVLQSYAISVSWIWVALAVITGTGLLSTLFLRELDLDQQTMGRQGYQDHQTFSTELVSIV